jgi:FdhD protein
VIVVGRITARRRVVRQRVGAAPLRGEDTVAVEEPLEIRVGGRAMAITMRTPGNDVELAIGYLLSEGIIRSAADVQAGRFCAGATDEGVNTYNVLDIALTPGVPAPDPSLARAFYTSSSCGLCGRASIDAVKTRSVYGISDSDTTIDAASLADLPQRLRDRQAVFDKTGGLHAAGLFDAATGELLVVREDIGRHNAVDKVIGWAAQAGRLPARGTVLMVSGRASFELTQKAWMAGIPVLAAVSAPSSLAVDLAAEAGMTLIGFLRGDSMVIYTGAERVAARRTGEGSAA